MKQNPLAVYRQEDGRIIYVDFYQDTNRAYGQEVVVEVDNGRVVTVYSMGNNTLESALAKIKENASKDSRSVLYVRPDLQNVDAHHLASANGSDTALTGDDSLSSRPKGSPFGHSGLQSDNASTGSAPLNVSDKESIAEVSNESNTHAEITGPALAGRGAAFQTQTGRDYSFGTGRASSKQRSTKASEAQTLTSLRDIQNAVAELAPVRRGLSVRNRNVLGYFKRDAGVIRSRYSHDAETILHEAGHKLDQALKIRQSVAESQQAKLTDELCELGKGSSPAEYGKIYDTVKGNEQLLLPVIGDLERGIRVAPPAGRVS